MSTDVTIQHGEEINNSTGVSAKKLLMWVFLGSDVMFFGTFIATFMAYRNKSLVGPYPEAVSYTHLTLPTIYSV